MQEAADFLRDESLRYPELHSAAPTGWQNVGAPTKLEPLLQFAQGRETPSANRPLSSPSLRQAVRHDRRRFLSAGTWSDRRRRCADSGGSWLDLGQLNKAREHVRVKERKEADAVST